MATWYAIEKQLVPIQDHESLPQGVPVASVMTTKEFFGFVAPEYHDTVLSLVKVENTYLDAFPHCLIGSFAVPDKQDLLADPICFAFYLDKNHLFFLDDGTTCAGILGQIASFSAISDQTTAFCLFEFMRLLIKGDQSFLARMEDEMELVEEKIMGQKEQSANQVILNYRRRILKLDTYYQQLNDMASDLLENEDDQFTGTDLRYFAEIRQNTDRLVDRVHMLQEYSMQLRELYNTQLNLQQNNIMQFFTVVATLGTPLMLIAGWFGMNFSFIPGADMPYGFFGCMAASAVIFLLELLFLKRKGWL